MIGYLAKTLFFLSLYPIFFVGGFSLSHNYLMGVKKVSMEDTYIIISVFFFLIHTIFLLTGFEFIGLPLYSSYSAYVLCVKYYLQTMTKNKVLRTCACNALIYSGIYSKNWLFTFIISITLLCDVQPFVNHYKFQLSQNSIDQFNAICSTLNIASVLYAIFCLEGVITRIVATALLVYIHHIDESS